MTEDRFDVTPLFDGAIDGQLLCKIFIIINIGQKLQKTHFFLRLRDGFPELDGLVLARSFSIVRRGEEIMCKTEREILGSSDSTALTVRCSLSSSHLFRVYFTLPTAFTASCLK